MKVRHKETQVVWSSGSFNTHSVNEIIINHEELGSDSDFIINYDVWIEAKKVWMELRHAFKNKDIITDNYNRYFFEPKTQADRDRSYTLD